MEILWNIVQRENERKRERNYFTKYNNMTLNETERRNSSLPDATRSNQSDKESDKYGSTSFNKLKVSFVSY